MNKPIFNPNQNRVQIVPPVTAPAVEETPTTIAVDEVVTPTDTAEVVDTTPAEPAVVEDKAVVGHTLNLDIAGEDFEIHPKEKSENPNDAHDTVEEGTMGNTEEENVNDLNDLAEKDLNETQENLAEELANSVESAPNEPTDNISDADNEALNRLIEKSDDPKLNEVLAEAFKSANENEDIQKIRELQEKQYEERDINELTPEGAEDLGNGLIKMEQSFPVDAAGKPDFKRPDREAAPASDVDILHIDDLENADKEAFKENFKSIAASHEISDESAAGLLDLLLAYRKDKSISVYNKMPEEIKSQVRQICAANGIELKNANSVAKMMLEELISETATDQTFIDFDKSINEAMKIPSLVDMYEDQNSENILEKIPKMAAAIENEDPEKAQMLRNIAKSYEKSVNFSFAKEQYDTVSRIRKHVRRDYMDYIRFANELNMNNRKSKFRIPDATTIPPIVMKVILADDTEITQEDVAKFLTLIFRSCANLDNYNVDDASYIYYLLKNLSMLAYINDDTKSNAESFSAELISNIKAMIYYIRAKEAEFNVNNQSKR